MKKAIWAGLILIVLTSCKTTKQSTTEIEQGKSTTIENVSSQDLLRKLETLWTITSENSSTWGSITTITFYDTDKPADPETGKYPIAAEYTRRDSSTVQTTTSTVEQTIDTTIESKTDSTVYQQRDTISIKEETKTKRTPLTSTASFKIIIALLLVIGALIAYLKYKEL